VVDGAVFVEPPSPAFAARVEVDLSLQPPAQRRWTVLIRWILCVPVAIAIVAIDVVALFWVIGAWFAALVTTRVPDGLHRRLLGVTQLLARLTAYANLLTDTWPGVHFEPDDGDAVAVIVERVTLRRSAVLFRLILMIPSAVVASVIATGVYPYLVVMWLFGSIRGRTPQSLHQAVALSLRFNVRATAFALMLTSTQPFRGFFGDGRERTASTTGDGSGPDATNVPAPTESLAGVGTGDGSVARRPSGPWLVVPAVKTLLIVALVIGALGQSVNNRWDPHHRFGVYFYWHVGSPRNRTLVIDANNSIVSTTNAFARAISTCASTACVSSAATLAAGNVIVDINNLKDSYVANSAARARYRTFTTVVTAESRILQAMSTPTTTLAQDRQLLAKLTLEQQAQYPAAVALTKLL